MKILVGNLGIGLKTTILGFIQEAHVTQIACLFIKQCFCNLLIYTNYFNLRGWILRETGMFAKLR